MEKYLCWGNYNITAHLLSISFTLAQYDAVRCNVYTVYTAELLQTDAYMEIVLLFEC